MTILSTHLAKQSDRSLADHSDLEIYQALLEIVKEKSQGLPVFNSKKKLYYVSAEFLIGKLLSNNLLNLGIYDEIEAELKAAGKTLATIEEAENEPSLGNGGLGRLAACFVDSMSSLGMTADGVGLNYHFGLFRQMIVRERQEAVRDKWLTRKSWLVRSERTYEVPFNNFSVRSRLYDIDVLGYNQEKKNRLRLFDLESVDESIVGTGINFNKNDIMRNLTLFLYPDDSDHDGKLLRIYQQYFMVSNAAQLILDEAIERGSNLHDLADYVVIQTNDTHPALLIPELIRLLQARGISRDEAIQITRTVCAYTNHTILAEALERWPIDDLETVCPHLIDIIRDLDYRVKAQFPNRQDLFIVDQHRVVSMAAMQIHYGFSVNGVAALHSDILMNSELKHFSDAYPGRFNNKTNGITFRRWIMNANPELARFFDQHLGEEWRTNHNLEGLADLVNDKDAIKAIQDIKLDNKVALKEHLQRTQNVTINEHSILDTQIKRFHEYKRQQMNALWVIHKYLEIKAGKIPATPITVFFGGKAAPAYKTAQDIIHLIATLSKLIDNDPDVSNHLQVVMIENYNVSHAEYLIPASDISEQISLASKEASGTGNMKFMLNGALTLGTMDGANVEIYELVGDDNIFIFGKESDEIIELYDNYGYHSGHYYHREAIKPLVDFIVSDSLLDIGDARILGRLHDELVNKDWFMTLIDIEDYIKVKQEMLDAYEDQEKWTQMTIENMAKAGYFSSDRTIFDYNNDIWRLEADENTIIPTTKRINAFK